MSDDLSPKVLFDNLQVPVGLGLLRLSTEGRPSWEQSIEIIHAALNGGIRILDTADSYCLDHKDFHYGERLALAAKRSWDGPQDEVHILTKVGLVRPGGKWIPNGSPKHIVKSVEDSLEALATDQIELLQLHVKDSKVPFDETLAALTELLQSGKVRYVGLSNIGPGEVRQANRFFPIASIQCELSISTRKSAQDGMLLMAQDMGIPFLAYRPLGGVAKAEKLSTNRVLSALALRRACTAQEIALAAVIHSSSNVIPLVGATRITSVESALRAASIRLDISDTTAIGIKYSFQPSADGIASVRTTAIPNSIPTLLPNQGPGSDPEVVLLMGIQGAGKSELVEAYVDRGYIRLNRDLRGGKVDDLLEPLQQLLSQGETRIVLDNTYPTRISRAPVVRCAHQAGVPVRCRFLDTPIKEARINIVQRVLARYERLLGPEDFKSLAKQDPNLPPPVALQRWLDTLEHPTLEEGFSAIDLIPFTRRPDHHRQKAILLDVDGTIRKTKSGEIYPRTVDDIEILSNRTEKLRAFVDDGYLLFFVSNQSGIASAKLSDDDVRHCFERTIALLGLPIAEYVYCPHPAFPVGCYCRKPMPGMAVYLKRKYHLDLRQSIMVGDMESDAQFAENVQIPYVSADRFFAE